MLSNESSQVLIEALILGQAIGFVGSYVGGLEAKKRKEEAERLNESLLQVTKELRKQARAHKKALVRNVAHGPTHDSQEHPKRVLVLERLKKGKASLQNRKGEDAKHYFEDALVKIDEASEEMEVPWKARRKAIRGLGAAHELLGEHDVALQYMQEVLSLSQSHNDRKGLGDAYGVIADIYTEMGDYASAAQWYDKYIAEMEA